jgi:adenosine deaminase
MPTTVHAGEADGLLSIESALLDGRALRLGHGVRIADDIVVTSEDDEAAYVALGPIAQWVKDREITLEVCPTSNLFTDAVPTTDLADHPFDLLYQLGFRVTVSPDNRLMTGASLSQELSSLVDAFGYDLTDLEVFQLNAAASAFLPIDDREELADRISAGFEQA